MTGPLAVALVGRFDAPWALEWSYLRAFEAIGHEVLPIEPPNRLRRILASPFVARLPLLASLVAGRSCVRKAMAMKHADLVVVVKGTDLDPRSIRDFRRLFPRVVCFNPDDPWNPLVCPKNVRDAVGEYDAYFIWSRSLRDRIAQSCGATAFYLPFGCDPVLHSPAYDLGAIPEPDGDLSFLGTWDPTRSALLRRLAGVDLRLYGNGWKRWHRATGAAATSTIVEAAVTDRQFAAAAQASVASLNILRIQNRGAHNMRTFELPACGAAMITTWSSEQVEFFEPASEMLTYEGPEQIMDHVTRLRRDKQARTSLMAAAYRRSHEHRYTRRARSLLACLAM